MYANASMNYVYQQPGGLIKFFSETRLNKILNENKNKIKKT